MPFFLWVGWFYARPKRSLSASAHGCYYIRKMTRPEKKIFATLFFSIFAAVTGVGIVVPLLPVYANNLGASGLYIGMIFGAFSLSRTILLPYFGRLSDRRGRKPFIVAGLLAYSVVSIAFIFSKTVETLIIIRLFHGMASAMMMPVIQAYIGDITPAGKEGFSMGVFNMSMFLGLSLGPLAGGVIKDHFSLQAAFICMGSLSMVGFLLSIIFLPPTSTERVLANAKVPKGLKALMSDSYITGLFSFRFAYTACIGIIWGFVPVYADARFGLSSALIGVLVTIGVFLSGLIHAPMGYLADRFSRVKLVVIGGILVAVSVWGFGLANSFWGMMTASIFFGLGGGISNPALTAMGVRKGSQAEAMGSVMAYLTVAHSLGMLAGSLLGGMMMDLFQLRQAFLLGMLIMLAGVVAFYLLTRPEPAAVPSVVQGS